MDSEAIESASNRLDFEKWGMSYFGYDFADKKRNGDYKVRSVEMAWRTWSESKKFYCCES